MILEPTRADDPDDLPPGTEIAGGRFVIEARLGQGGVATVYRVRTSGGEKLALKLMCTRRSADADQRERFTNEWRLLKALAGVPYVVQVHETGRHEDGRPWFSMELLTAPTLSQLIHQRGGVPKLRLCEALRDVASAVADLHARGIIHRDIKPENVMVGEDGIRLLDFGYAYTEGSEQVPSIAGLTQVEHRPGTRWYMAPEQVQSPNAAPSFDVYALAVSLYEVIVGRVPNSDLSEQQMMLVKCVPTNDELTIRGRAFDLDDELVELVDHGLRRDPAERIATAGEFRDRLAAIVARLRSAGATNLRKGRAPALVDGHLPSGTEVIPRDSTPRVVARGDTEVVEAAAVPVVQVSPRRHTERAAVPKAVPRGLTAPANGALAPEEMVARVVELNAMARAVEASDESSVPRRRWPLIVAAVVGMLGLALLWVWSRDDAEPAALDEDPPAAAAVVSPSPPEPEPVRTEPPPSTAQPRKDSRPATEAVQPQVKPEPVAEPAPEPEASPPNATEPKPRAKPHPDSAAESLPPCDDVEAQAIAASQEARWSKVLELTKFRRCWKDLSTRSFLRVWALAELGRNEECAKLGASSPSTEARRMADRCRSQLDMEKNP